MQEATAPPLGLVVIAKFIGFASLLLAWAPSLVFCVMAFPLLGYAQPSLLWLLLWLVTLVLAPIFGIMMLRRVKDASWNGLLDPACAIVLCVLCGIATSHMMQRIAAVELA
jgi:hypothetical protein